MDVNKILNADILDILFDGKNKEYGAYQLRKNYPKTMTRALLITAALILLVFLHLYWPIKLPKNQMQRLMYWKRKWQTLKKMSHFRLRRRLRLHHPHHRHHRKLTR